MKITVTDGKTWEGTLEQWDAHDIMIVKWCSGAEIERFCPLSGSSYDFAAIDQQSPEFRLGCTYRVKSRSPVAGEVWGLSGYTYLVFENGCIRIDTGQVVIGLSAGMVFLSNSVKEHFATEQVK